MKWRTNLGSRKKQRVSSHDSSGIGAKLEQDEHSVEDLDMILPELKIYAATQAQ